jgi:hypothetical protein
LLCALVALAFTNLSHAQFTPSGGANVGGEVVNFSWPSVVDAAFYTVQVSFDSGDFSSPPFSNQVSAPTTNVDVNGLPNDGSTLFWRVVTEDAFLSQIDVSPVQNFVNGSGITLGTPNLLYPPNGSVLEVNRSEFTSWDPVPNATHYKMDLDDDSGFGSPTSLTVPGKYGLDPDTSPGNSGTEFFWRVQACRTPPSGGPEVCGSFSSTFSFTIGTLTGPDILIVPNPVNLSAQNGETQIQEGFAAVINTGDQALSFDSVTQQPGADWLTFDVLDSTAVASLGLPAQLLPFEFAYIQLNADPNNLATSSYMAVLDVGSNDPDENPYPGGLKVNFDITFNPVTETYHPADDAPYGNRDNIVSQAEINNFMQAWLNGQHSDFNGILSGVFIADNGGAYYFNLFDFIPICSDAKFVETEVFACIPPSGDPMGGSPFTIDGFPVGDFDPVGPVVLKKLAGAGKAEIRRASDSLVVLGVDDMESADLYAEIKSNAGIDLVAVGDTAGTMTLMLEYTYPFNMMDITCPMAEFNTITVTVIPSVDLDIDSDNTNAVADFGPDRNDAEEMIEDMAGMTGRIVKINSDDDDNDMIPDLGDGFNLNGCACTPKSVLFPGS